MKIKATLLLITLFILVQITLAQDKTVNIECNLSTNETEWVKNSQLTATLTVKNNSDKEVEIHLPPHFILEKKKIDNSRIVFGDEYGSREVVFYFIKTKKDKLIPSKIKPRQHSKFFLLSGESKTIEFNLSTLVWNEQMSSIKPYYLVSERFVEPNNNWHRTVLIGDYKLYYDWNYNLDKDKNEQRMVNITSNKIDVKLNSKK